VSSESKVFEGVVRVLEGCKRTAHLHTVGVPTEHQPCEEADQKESKKGKTKSGDGERQDTKAWKMSFSNWNL
jgi:hypothetical protein